MSGAFDGGDGNPAAGNGGSGAGEIMLFGVRLVVDSMRKSVSLNNLSQYVHPHDLSSGNGGSSGFGAGHKEKEEASAAVAPIGVACYASSDDVVINSASSSSCGRERKRGVPWTEDEHRLFLLGLERVGKGDWRGISRNFVKTRTPTQVASHAQKYFLRRTNINRRRRRSSLFDITTDTVTANQPEKAPVSCQGDAAPVLPVPLVPMLLPFSLENPVDEPSLNLVRPASAAPAPQPPILGSYLSLSLKTSAEKAPSLPLNISLPPGQSDAVFLTMSSFSNGESIISVA